MENVAPLLKERPLVIAIRLSPCAGWLLFFYLSRTSSSRTDANKNTEQQGRTTPQQKPLSDTQLKDLATGQFWRGLVDRVVPVSDASKADAPLADATLKEVIHYDFWARVVRKSVSFLDRTIDNAIKGVSPNSTSASSSSYWPSKMLTGMIETIQRGCKNAVRPPTESEIQAMLVTYGFTFRKWASRLYTLVTHQHVHASLAHLWSNIVSFATVSMEFGTPVRNYQNSSNNERSHQQQRASSPIIRPWMADVLRGTRACLCTMLVFTVGGIAGGLPAQWLYAEYLTTEAKAKYGMNNKVVQKVVGTLKQARKERTIMCGASAGICALSGFNAVYYDRYLSAMLTILPCTLSLLQEAIAQSRHSPDEPSSWVPRLQRAWRDVVGNQEVLVGQAAHVGGFLAGCAIGYGLRFYVRRRQAAYTVDDRHGDGGRPRVPPLGMMIVHRDPQQFEEIDWNDGIDPPTARSEHKQREHMN